MKIRTSLIAFLAVTPFTLVMTGCGGGGGSSSGGGGTTTPTALNYSIEWATRTKTTAPASALSFTLTIKNSSTGAVVLTDTRNRGTNTASHTSSYTTSSTVTPGTYVATFTFYAAEGGSGTAGNDVVGIASQSVTVPQTGSLPTITTEGSVTTLIVDSQQISVGDEVVLDYTAANENGEVLVLSPGSAKWEVISGTSALQVTQNGYAVKGIAGGTATVRLTVDGVSTTAGVEVISGEPTTLTLNTNDTVLWAAYQDGTGAWQPATVTDSTITASINSSKYGIAYVSGSSDIPTVHVYYATTAEATSVTLAPLDSTTEADLSGEVTNLGDGERLSVFGYTSSNLVVANGAYTVPLREKAPWDLVISREDADLNILGLGIQRDLATLPLTGVDLDATSYTAPENFTLTLTGGETDLNSVYAELVTSNATYAPMGYANGDSLTYAALATALRTSTDRYAYYGYYFGDSFFQQVSKIAATPSNTGLTLSSMPSTPTVSTTGSGEGTQFTAEFTLPSAGQAVEAQVTGAISQYTVTASKGWLGTGNSFTTPLLSDVAGFDSAWLLGDVVGYSTRLYTNNGSVADLLDAAALTRDGYTYEFFDWYSNTENRTSKTKVRKGLPGAPARVKVKG